MAGERAATEPGPSRRRRHSLTVAVRYVIGVALGIVVLLLLAGQRGELLAAWRQLAGVDVGWVAVAVLAEAMSIGAFAWLQHRILRLSGARIPIAGLAVLSLANDAIASTVPGEPAVSSAYRYRYYRRSGVSGASAGWTIFTSLIAQAIGMALILLIGVVVALTGNGGGRGVGVALLGRAIVAAAVVVLIRRDLILRLADLALRATRGLTGHPRGDVGARIEATLVRMREIPLSGRSMAGIAVIALTVWGFDFLCLLCGFDAVRAEIPWHGVLLAYGISQVVAALPIVPGGIGIVEGSLAVILAAYGAGRVPALAVALVFRFVT